MATNMDKALTQAPAGLEALAQDESPIEIEIEIVDPEAVHIGIGDMDISIEKGEGEGDFNANLADEMTSGALQSVAGDLIDDIENDKNNRRTGRRFIPRD